MGIYLNFNSVQGDVTEKEHTGWIEVLDAQWSTSRSIRSAVGASTNRESSSAYVSEFTITKYVDKSSHELTTSAMTGAAVTNVEVDFTRTNQEGELTFRKIVMTDVIISSLVNSGHNQDRPTETLSFNFTQIAVTDTTEDDAGTPVNNKTVTFDLGLSKVT
ncbi:type VI secretion system tube protein Hcp [Acetobacter sacchari]|uniref:Type VI secretion system tube protein Hcp n=1 Tax=Acetobacter sacchari TaxID=2661687 RepID=A0ABS3LRR2_9PROT|nr:type VI secretion system tube protein Hcp [Acetobacter sacchari]MBO1358581.1 type VI secretion system tube protein Hcp [Acetobacter sacchari]